MRADISNDAFTDDIDTHAAAARASVRSAAGHGQVQLHSCVRWHRSSESFSSFGERGAHLRRLMLTVYNSRNFII